MSWRRGLSVVLVALGIGSSVLAWTGWSWLNQTVLSDLPDDLSHLAEHAPLATACEVVDLDGALLDTFYVERRYPVHFEQLPHPVWQAFVASEDAAFFEHGGVDPLGIARALVVNLRAGRTVQGGSTLTQQVVKNVLLSSERTYERKLREAVLARRLEAELSKEQILELYLELVYLGGGNYGVEAAARDYFGVPAAQLDVGQAALLAGLVPAPSRYAPDVSEERARDRRRLVLRRMVAVGYLTAEEAAYWGEQPLGLRSGAEDDGRQVSASYLTAARREIRQAFGDRAGVAGLRVTVPIDHDLQAVAEEAAREAEVSHLGRQGPLAIRRRGTARSDLPPAPTSPCFVGRVGSDRRTLHTEGGSHELHRAAWWSPVHDERVGRPVALAQQVQEGDWLAVCDRGDGLVVDDTPWARSAVVVLDIETGHVVAVADGQPTPLEGFVRALQARRQPGSSFKPYVYAAAFAQGWSLLGTAVDAPLSLPGAGGRAWQPKNYGGGYAGRMTLRTALRASNNTIPIRLTLEVGAEAVVDLAAAAGVASPLRADPTIALGSSEVTPLDQATGYATLARGGQHRRSTFLADVRVAEADLTPLRPASAAMSPGVAWEVVEGLRAVVTEGTGRVADVPERFVAGKTGTTNDAVDAWFVGLTERYAVAVWVGTDGHRSLGERETGGRAAGPAFRRVVEATAPGTARVAPPEVVRVPYQGRVIGLRRATVPTSVLPRRNVDGPLQPLDQPASQVRR